MLYRNAPALLLVAAVLCFSGCVCPNSYVRDTGVGCGGCGVAPCDPCGDCAVGGCGCGPLARGVKNCLTCGSGCGDVYWGEWSDCPPDCCDPCCGVGCDPCCSPWAPLRGLFHLWGYRYAPASGMSCGCDTCGAPGEMYMSGEYMPAEMETYEKLEPPKPQPEPTTAAGLRRPVRHAQHTRVVRQ